MTCQDKKLLRTLRHLTKNKIDHEYTFWIDDDNQRLYLFNSDIYTSFAEIKNFYLILKHLEQEKYIAIDSSRPYYFQLEYNGIYYYQLLWDSFKNFLLKSIFVPIAVSALTSFLATFTAYLWSH